MKRAKQVLAIIGVIALVLLYLSTVIFAILGKDFMNWLMASVAVTIFLPIILWIFNYLQKFKKGDDELELFRNLKKKDE